MSADFCRRRRRFASVLLVSFPSEVYQLPFGFYELQKENFLISLKGYAKTFYDFSLLLTGVYLLSLWLGRNNFLVESMHIKRENGINFFFSTL